MLKAKLLLGMLLLLFPLAVLGTSLRMLDPLDGMERGSVDVRFGDPLRIDDPKAEGLFGGDIGRAERFAAAAKAKLEALLTEREIQIDPDSEFGVVVNIYGGHSPTRDCEGTSLFYMQVTVWSRDKDSGEADTGYSRTYLGNARAEELEIQLMKAVDDSATDIRSYRE